MITSDQAALLMDSAEVVGSDGQRIGKVGQFYLDNSTGNPSWVTIKTGFFGGNESFVPLDDATASGDVLSVPYDKDRIKGAPNHSAGAELSVEDEDELYAYYAVGRTTESSIRGLGVGSDTALASSDSAEGYLTRSEEQLHVGTQRVATGKARLRKFVVTEQQTVAVPLTHEEVQIVREPIAPGEIVNPSIAEDVIEVTLTEEQVVVAKDAVAVERVRLQTGVVTEQQTVTESVRKEQIEVQTTDGTTVADTRDAVSKGRT